MRYITSSYKRSIDWYTSVLNLLNGSSGLIPYLFLDTNWLQPETMQSPMKDNAGNDLLFGGQPRPFSSFNKFTSLAAQGFHPFWSPVFKKYFWSEQPTLPCSLTSTLGATWSNVSGKIYTTISLYDRSFTTRNYPASLTSKSVKTEVEIRQLPPRSSTLLHECFHAVLETTYLRTRPVSVTVCF